MSLRLEHALIAPHAAGLTEGSNPNNRRQYQYIAYQRPDGYTWFAATIRENGRMSDTGDYWIHYLQSVVRIRKIRARSDHEVAAIDTREFRRPSLLEERWWADYNNELSKLYDAEKARVIASGQRWLNPSPTKAMQKAAAKFAHDMVKVREPEDWGSMREQVEEYEEQEKARKADMRAAGEEVSDEDEDDNEEY